MRKRLYAVLIFSLMALALLKVPYFFTQGFRMNKILISEKCILPSQVSPVDCDTKEIKEILSQTFSFLGRGRQIFAFESADKKYVLKLLRYDKYQKPLWAHASFFFHVFEKQAQTYLKEQKERFEKVQNSYRIAFEEIPDVTAIVYIHPYATQNIFEQTVLVKDGIGRTFHLPLDRVGFLVQKKAEPLKNVLLKIYKEKKIEEWNELVSSIFENVSKRSSKGIFNTDFVNLLRNSAVLNGKVIEIDVGSFGKDLSFSKEDFFMLESGRFGQALLNFSKKKMPLFVDLLEEQMKKAIAESSSESERF